MIYNVSIRGICWLIDSMTNQDMTITELVNK